MDVDTLKSTVATPRRTNDRVKVLLASKMKEEAITRETSNICSHVKELFSTESTTQSAAEVIESKEGIVAALKIDRNLKKVIAPY